MELTVDGRRVYAATGGREFDAAKPAVVFLHGAGCDHTVWQLPARWFAWHGPAAKLGGHPVPGLWMTGGTLALFARNRPGVLHADLEACHAWKSGPEAARKVRCPALVIIAANDIMTPAKAGQELARLVADSRSITVQNCGHMLPAEAPDAVVDALIDFFAPISADAR